MNGEYNNRDSAGTGLFIRKTYGTHTPSKQVKQWTNAIVFYREII